jgi:hypothetical protein
MQLVKGDNSNAMGLISFFMKCLQVCFCFYHVYVGEFEVFAFQQHDYKF